MLSHLVTLLASSTSAASVPGDRDVQAVAARVAEYVKSGGGLSYMGTACDHHIQLVHIQDSTDTFYDDMQLMVQTETVKSLMEHLLTMFSKVDYTFATFHDKLRPITGHGVSGGWWTEERWDESLGGRGSVNTCYSLMGDLTSDPQKAQDIFNLIPTNGGKDFYENQWDALRRAAIDPTITWDLRDYDDDGLPIVRIALLVTDDGAHTAEATFADNVRNPNREWFKQSGPFHNAMANPYQKCNIDGSRAISNNINTAYGDLKNGAPQGTSMSDNGACWGWNINKAGALRSLKGTLSFMEYFYGFGEDEEIIGMVECGPLLNDSNCADYWSFSTCCTTWGNTMRKGACVPGTDHFERFPDFQSCADFGGKYARCHPNEITASNPMYTGNEDHPMSRPYACITETPEWQSVQGMEPSEKFWMGLQDNKIDEIVEYPYGQEIFDIDCSSYEYPNPRDPRYAEPFLARKILPVVIASPPSDKLVVDPSSIYLGSYDASALRMSTNNCPGLEHDPYTTYTCNETLFGKWYCYNPFDYPQFYPYAHKDESTWAADNSTSWWRNRCTTEECGRQWWTECMEVEYKESLDIIAQGGVNATFQIMDPAHMPDVIIQTIEAAIQKALDIGPECLDPTTTTIEPTTTSTTTTTTSTTTTTTTTTPMATTTTTPMITTTTPMTTTTTPMTTTTAPMTTTTAPMTTTTTPMITSTTTPMITSTTTPMITTPPVPNTYSTIPNTMTETEPIMISSTYSTEEPEMSVSSNTTFESDTTEIDPDCPCSAQCDPCKPCPCVCHTPCCDGKKPAAFLKLDELPEYFNMVISNE